MGTTLPVRCKQSAPPRADCEPLQVRGCSASQALPSCLSCGRNGRGGNTPPRPGEACYALQLSRIRLSGGSA